MGVFDKIKKFRPMGILEDAQGLSGMQTGAQLMEKYKKAGINYGPAGEGEDPTIYDRGQEMMNRDSAYNQGIRAQMESSSADAQAEAMRQQQRMAAMGGGNMPMAAMTAQGLQSANRAQANTAQQFEQGQMAREQRGVGVLSGAMANQAQLVQQAMGADQARNMAKANALQQGMGIMGGIYGGMADMAEKGVGMAMGIPPLPKQKGGYIKGYQEGGRARYSVPKKSIEQQDDGLWNTKVGLRVETNDGPRFYGGEERGNKIQNSVDEATEIALQKFYTTPEDSIRARDVRKYLKQKGMMYGGPVKMQTGGLLGLLKKGMGKAQTAGKNFLDSGGVRGKASRSLDSGLLGAGIEGAGKLYGSVDWKGLGSKMKTGGTGLLGGVALGGIGALRGLEAINKEASMPGYLQSEMQLNKIGEMMGNETEKSPSFLKQVYDHKFGKQQGGYMDELESYQHGGSVVDSIPMRIGGGKLV